MLSSGVALQEAFGGGLMMVSSGILMVRRTALI